MYKMGQDKLEKLKLIVGENEHVDWRNTEILRLVGAVEKLEEEIAYLNGVIRTLEEKYE